MFLNSLIGLGKESKKKVHTLNFDQTVYGLLSSTDLLTTKMIKGCLEELPSIINLSTEYYKSLYNDLLDNFANFVQILPTENKAGMASILVNGVIRACHVIKVHKEKSDDSHNHMKNYVIFSATLMLEVGKVIDDRQVIVCNDEGEYITAWNPFEGPMSALGQYFKLRELAGMPQRYYQSINALIARQIMPSMGFNWIAEHPLMLEAWLAILAGTIPKMDGLEYFIEVIKEWHALDLENQGFYYPGLVDSHPSSATSLGEQLLAWIKAQLSGGSITVNEFDSMLHMTEQGLLVQPALFDAFIKSEQNTGVVINRASLEDQLAKMGVTKDIAGDGRYAQFHLVNPNAPVSSRGGVFGAPAGVSQQHAGGPATVVREGVIVNQNLIYGPSNTNIPPANPLLKTAMFTAAAFRSQHLPGGSNIQSMPPLFHSMDPGGK